MFVCENPQGCMGVRLACSLFSFIMYYCCVAIQEILNPSLLVIKKLCEMCKFFISVSYVAHGVLTKSLIRCDLEVCLTIVVD